MKGNNCNLTGALSHQYKPQACWKGGGRGEAGGGAYAPSDFGPALTARPPDFWPPRITRPPDFQTLQHA